MNRLYAWKNSQLPHLCLDLRTQAQYNACHLIPSTNIPFSQLVVRQAELPPKYMPMAVLHTHDTTHAIDWLIQRGWHCPFVIPEEALDWKQLIEQRWAASCDGRDNQKWVLFQPSPFLKKHISYLEAKIERPTRTCLDMGCGAGRDISWIVSTRQHWRATAFDSQPGAIQRMTQLVHYLNIQDRVQIGQVKFQHNQTWKWISKPVPIQTYDLVLNIRFLSRPFWYKVPSLLNKGGCFVLSQFLHDDDLCVYDQPKRSHRLEKGEIEEVFGQMEDMEIIMNEIEKTEDGRPLQCVIIKRINP
ncbi:Uncharacterized protein UNK4.09 [Choanephora cucurbitarum]|uniref:Uncharacterized protein UNK4.09 n=1 Tax=Choanephora cucurbitarum TaxID=101091 RepID=A0A1C7NSC2_9FUNG|nr:Uncharacterized protein UNK4.09 [Choanephora cucurbitarum]